MPLCVCVCVCVWAFVNLPNWCFRAKDGKEWISSCWHALCKDTRACLGLAISIQKFKWCAHVATHRRRLFSNSWSTLVCYFGFLHNWHCAVVRRALAGSAGFVTLSLRLSLTAESCPDMDTRHAGCGHALGSYLSTRTRRKWDWFGARLSGTLLCSTFSLGRARPLFLPLAHESALCNGFCSNFRYSFCNDVFKLAENLTRININVFCVARAAYIVANSPLLLLTDWWVMAATVTGAPPILRRILWQLDLEVGAISAPLAVTLSTIRNDWTVRVRCGLHLNVSLYQYILMFCVCRSQSWLGAVFHRMCLKCKDCNKLLDKGSINEHQGGVYCRGKYVYYSACDFFLVPYDYMWKVKSRTLNSLHFMPMLHHGQCIDWLSSLWADWF